MKKVLAAVVSSVLSLVAMPVFAAGPYVGLEGGALWLSDASITYSGVKEGDISFDTGWGIGVVGGYDFGTWRLEGELAYRSSSADKFTDTAGDSASLGGDMTSTALMVNAYYDFKSLSPSVYPYLGAGIGGASVAADLDVSGVKVVDDDEIVFAYQFVAGVAFPVSKQLAIDVNYRYFATTDPKIKDVDGEEFETEYGSHNVFLGLRYNF